MRHAGQPSLYESNDCFVMADMLRRSKLLNLRFDMNWDVKAHVSFLSISIMALLIVCPEKTASYSASLALFPSLRCA